MLIVFRLEQQDTELRLCNTFTWQRNHSNRQRTSFPYAVSSRMHRLGNEFFSDLLHNLRSSRATVVDRSRARTHTQRSTATATRSPAISFRRNEAFPSNAIYIRTHNSMGDRTKATFMRIYSARIATSDKRVMIGAAIPANDCFGAHLQPEIFARAPCISIEYSCLSKIVCL